LIGAETKWIEKIFSDGRYRRRHRSYVGMRAGGQEIQA